MLIIWVPSRNTVSRFRQFWIKRVWNVYKSIFMNEMMCKVGVSTTIPNIEIPCHDKNIDVDFSILKIL